MQDNNLFSDFREQFMILLMGKFASILVLVTSKQIGNCIRFH